MDHSRRHFLRKSGYSALGAAALTSGFGPFGMVQRALAQGGGSATDYKALVCIFLFGGNDGNNTIVPLDTGEHTSYAQMRGELTLAKDSLLPVASPSTGGRQFGLHASLPELQSLWSQGKVAALCNVGTLVEPLTREQYRSGASAIHRPESLFSHSDQQAQWQASLSTGQSQTGWGGRIADRTEGLNGGARFPMIVSMAGAHLFTTSTEARPLAITPGASFGLQGFNNSPEAAARLAAVEQLLKTEAAEPAGATLVRSADETTLQAIVNSRLLNSALGNQSALQSVFPTTSIGRQLQQVSRIVAARGALGLKRQLFFCSLGGFDTHNGQLATQASLLRQLSEAMNAFYQSTVELGIASQVTTFTLSDFGRTLKPASGGGTDHAWGSHHLIMGGAVRGGNLYGAYPTLALAGPNDAGNEGRWIPTTSVDQYAATLARWYGLAEADVPFVFPNINRFPTANLGFMS